MANTWSIDEMTHGGKWPSFIDKRQWVDFKEIYHNRIALQARMGYTMSSPIWQLCSFMFSRLPASTQHPCRSPTLVVSFLLELGSFQGCRNMAVLLT